MEKKKPILSIRPRFDKALTLAESASVTLIVTAAVTSVLGLFLYILFSLIGLTAFVGAGGIFLTLFVLCLTMTPPAYFEIKKRALARTAFHFYEGYFEFQAFNYYLIRKRARVRYDDVADVTQVSRFLQGLNGLASIYIYVPSMGYQTRGNFAGVKIHDVPDNANMVARILDLIEKKTGAVEVVTVVNPVTADPTLAGAATVVTR